jgi:hypothetical protein
MQGSADTRHRLKLNLVRQCEDDGGAQGQERQLIQDSSGRLSNIKLTGPYIYIALIDYRENNRANTWISAEELTVR